MTLPELISIWEKSQANWKNNLSIWQANLSSVRFPIRWRFMNDAGTTERNP